MGVKEEKVEWEPQTFDMFGIKSGAPLAEFGTQTCDLFHSSLYTIVLKCKF